jgi:hypothetical protein
VIAEPTLTPWSSMNARLEAPAGLQLTLFTELEPAETAEDGEQGEPIGEAL